MLPMHMGLRFPDQYQIHSSELHPLAAHLQVSRFRARRVQWLFPRTLGGTHPAPAPRNASDFYCRAAALSFQWLYAEDLAGATNESSALARPAARR